MKGYQRTNKMWKVRNLRNVVCLKIIFVIYYYDRGIYLANLVIVLAQVTFARHARVGYLVIVDKQLTN
jgi:hypothetical protein